MQRDKSDFAGDNFNKTISNAEIYGWKVQCSVSTTYGITYGITYFIMYHIMYHVTYIMS